MDKGKRAMTADEVYEETQSKKRKARLNPDGLRRLQPNAVQQQATYDPSYQGQPPAELQFHTVDGSPTLLPTPEAATQTEVDMIVEVAREIDINLSKCSSFQPARRQRQAEIADYFKTPLVKSLLTQNNTSSLGSHTTFPRSHTTLTTSSPIRTPICHRQIQVPNVIPNKCIIAQRARREREKELAQSVLSTSSQTTDQTPPTPLEIVSQHQTQDPNEILNKRFIAQRARREREREIELARSFLITSSQSKSPTLETVSQQQIQFPSEILSKQTVAQRARREREKELRRSILSTSSQNPSSTRSLNIASLPNTLLAVDITSNMASFSHSQNEDIGVNNFDDDDDEEFRWVPNIEYSMLSQGRHFLGKMRDNRCPHCDAWHWKDERLSTSSERTPMFGMCCKKGTVNLTPLKELPPTLRELYDRNDDRSRSFQKHMREYNSAFAFTSLGFKLDDRVIHGQGPRSFIIHGELRHRTGSLVTDPGQEGKYSQLYIYDPSAALNVRQGRNPDLRGDVLKTIQEVMLQYNRWSKEFKHTHEVLSTEAASNGGNLNIHAHLHYSSKRDKRRYNLPTADEVAVILSGDGTEADSIRDIVIHLRSSCGLLQISECHSAYLPLHYVLMFPYGELGWSPELRRWNPNTDIAIEKRMTQMKFYAYLLFERRNEYSPMWRGRKLLHEFLCDAWAATEQNKLRWVRLKQSTIRAELYNGLTDVSVECLSPDQIGKRTILPSSHTGSPRHMFEIYQDSMAITSYNRHPDIFLTMTANPRWPEIVYVLLPGQYPTDRPDIIARVFELKRDALLEYIKTSGIFGVVVARVYTIEFQKRGLPHMHLLLYLQEPDKIHSVAQIDRIVCAEFLDPETEPELFATVITCMVHGPCGNKNPRAPCMENGVCTKHFPRAFTYTTALNEDGYPLYRRRDTGRTYFVKNMPVDNRDVVPYNPVLSKMFNCHINEEICAGVRCVKYIHKYIFKEHDRTTMVLNGLDEVQQYLDARYVGPVEAAWRLFEFPMHEEFPNVVRLEIHMEGFHRVLFNPTESIEVIRERAKLHKSTLTAYFDRCASDPYARQFTYQEFPQHYIWDAQQRCWHRRLRGSAIGRMYFVSPKDGDKFYLRLLLTVVRGPTSFTNLKTVGNDICVSFKEACIRRGFIEDDSEWAQCLREAANMQTGYQLRRIFSVILLECNPVYPHQLWNEFSEHICDDLAHKLRTKYHITNPTEEQVKDYGLYLLNGMLFETTGKSLKDFPPMPGPTGDWSEVVGNRLIWEQQQFQFSDGNARMHANAIHLNQEQRGAYEAVIKSVSRGDGKLFFLNGPAGTGKTFVYNTIAATCRSRGDIVIMVASSGIASLLLAGGRTSHSTFKIPFDVLDDSICGFSKKSPQAKLFRIAKLIIWDEVPMQHKFCVEAVDQTLRDTCNNNKLFGGITVVFGGDFRQCLPVIPKGLREQIVGACLRRSYLGRDVNVLTLVQNMRLENANLENIEFAQTLIEIGTSLDDVVQLPSAINSCTSIEELLATTYPGLNHQSTTSKYLTKRTILSARNVDVNEINLFALDVFHGEAKTYLGADSMTEVDASDPTNINQIPSEYLNSLEPSGLPPFALKLKVGCPIMALRNIAPRDGMCNGTRMKVLDVNDHVINDVVFTGDKAGE